MTSCAHTLDRGGGHHIGKAAAAPPSLEVLKVDGGVTANDLCMQMQSDILGVPVSRPVVAETTAWCRLCGGPGRRFWKDTDELRAHWKEDRRWTPQWKTNSARTVTSAGRRRSSGPWTGSTSTE